MQTAHSGALIGAVKPFSSRPLGLMLIGVGPHAQRTYVPHAQELGKRHGFAINVAVDVEAKRDELTATARERAWPFVMTFVQPAALQDQLPLFVTSELDNLIREKNIAGVIIATDPLWHKLYALWAVQRGLHVLMDKPISTRIDAVNDVVQAQGIYQDYRVIRREYDRQVGTSTCFLVNSHRRWHPGFDRALEFIRQIHHEFNCPVTSIQAFHCDGQWRFPDEIVQQTYHPYCLACGKISHSGYHVIDTVCRLLNAGVKPTVAADSFSVTTEVVRPDGLLQQLGSAEYQAIFGNAYSQRVPTDEMRRKFSRFAEVDAHSIIRFRRRSTTVATATIELQHNGFSRRDWPMPRTDRYKDAGRVRHEHYRIDCGPLQALEILSYQAKADHTSSGPTDFKIGGNNHFQIHLFRNNGITGDEVPYSVAYDQAEIESFDPARLVNEEVKKAPLLEFVRFIKGEIGKGDLRSNIESHELQVQLMAAMYESAASDEKVTKPIKRVLSSVRSTMKSHAALRGADA